MLLGDLNAELRLDQSLVLLHQLGDLFHGDGGGDIAGIEVANHAGNLLSDKVLDGGLLHKVFDLLGRDRQLAAGEVLQLAHYPIHNGIAAVAADIGTHSDLAAHIHRAVFAHGGAFQKLAVHIHIAVFIGGHIAVRHDQGHIAISHIAHGADHFAVDDHIAVCIDLHMGGIGHAVLRAADHTAYGQTGPHGGRCFLAGGEQGLDDGGNAVFRGHGPQIQQNDAGQRGDEHDDAQHKADDAHQETDRPGPALSYLPGGLCRCFHNRLGNRLDSRLNNGNDGFFHGRLCLLGQDLIRHNSYPSFWFFLIK